MDNTGEIRSPLVPIGNRRLSEDDNMKVTEAVGRDIGVENPKWVPMTLDEAMGLIVDANGELRWYGNDPTHPPELVLPTATVRDGIREGNFDIGNKPVTNPGQEYFIPYKGGYCLPSAWTVTIGATEAGKPRIGRVVDEKTGPGYSIVGIITMQLTNNHRVRTGNTFTAKYLRGSDMVFMRQDEVEQLLP